MPPMTAWGAGGDDVKDYKADWGKVKLVETSERHYTLTEIKEFVMDLENGDLSELFIQIMCENEVVYDIVKEWASLE